jgi:hypothetical protein
LRPRPRRRVRYLAVEVDIPADALVRAVLVDDVVAEILLSHPTTVPVDAWKLR